MDDELLLAGYLAVPRAEREGCPSRWLPEPFISLSRCLTGVEHGPEFWAWHGDPAAAARFDGHLLAIGFTRRDAAALVEAVCGDLHVEPADAEPLASLVRQEPMPAHAVLRGFEIIGVEFGLMSLHSWLCHGYEADAGVRLNQWGLTDTHAQASDLLAWILGLPSEEAPEPVYWTVAEPLHSRS
ncbi:hypothetical protein [Amycolatopsis methanolica]|uniref:hypothetical protein n=1 Tax=Amycolatopsis methanolica TaxID=1814 RepID=UPI003443C3E8